MAYTTIDDPSAYFQTALYSGSSSSVTVTNDGNSDLKPDWLWFKKRSATGDHNIFDTSRGLTERLFPDLNSASDSGSNGITSLTDGFTSGTFYGDVNANGQTFVTWQWKANGGTTTSNGASGDIKASVTQREDTAKFAICTYTGTGISSGQSHRVNHGLGTTPHVMMFKSRGASGDWVVYHHKNTDAPETDYLVLNEGNATADSANKFNDTAPNTSYATIGGDDNISSGTIVLYSFAEVQGYSKFGSYTGQENADGPFVYTGFAPAWIMIKQTDQSRDWLILDNKREPFNDSSRLRLKANDSGADDDSADNAIDFLSNGFKIRTGANGLNANTGNFIYMAFAESPFVSSEGVPCTAR